MTSRALSEVGIGGSFKTPIKINGVSSRMMVLRTHVSQGPLTSESVGEAVYEMHVANFFYSKCSDRLSDPVKEALQGIKTGLLISAKFGDEVRHYYVDTPTLTGTTTSDLFAEIKKDIQSLLSNTSSCYVMHFVVTKLEPFDTLDMSTNFGTCELIMVSAHKQGIVHCDLKSQNLCCINVDGEKHVVPIDFGFVRFLDFPDMDVPLHGPPGRTRFGTLCPFDIASNVTRVSGSNFADLTPAQKIEIAKLYDRACLALIHASRRNALRLQPGWLTVEMMCWDVTPEGNSRPYCLQYGKHVEQALKQLQINVVDEFYRILLTRDGRKPVVSTQPPESPSKVSTLTLALINKQIQWLVTPRKEPPRPSGRQNS